MDQPGHARRRPSRGFGRYDDAARANIAAVEADHRYFSERDAPAGIYPMFYAPHNLHFLWAAYLLSGQRAKALGAARTLGERLSPDQALEVAALQGFLPSTALTYVRFGDWPAVIAEPAPRDDLRYAKAMWHYAQGMARSARAELAQATVELDSVRAIAAEVTDEMIIILNPAPALLALAADVLEGETYRTTSCPTERPRTTIACRSKRSRAPRPTW